MLETCDAVIVGGGPAGSSCAWELGRAGLDVVLLDRAEFPRDKVCAGWITPQVVECLRLDLDEYARGRVLQPIRAFRTSILGSAEVETQYSRDVSYGIRRCEFDAYLLQRTAVRSMLSQPLSSLRRDGVDWVVNDRFRTRLLIGAGGHFCPVARQTSVSDPQDQPVVVAQEVEFELTDQQARACPLDGRIPELFFYPDLLGYAWCFRKGNFLNIGAGREGETRLSAAMDEFLRFLEKAGRIPADAAPRTRGHAYRLYRGRLRRMTADRVLLVGDALGLASPESGEGIRPAVESGLLAARAIVSCGRDGSDQAAPRFLRDVTARLGTPQRRSATTGLFARLRRSAARRLLSTPWFVRHVVLSRWFLHQEQPALHSFPGVDRTAG